MRVGVSAAASCDIVVAKNIVVKYIKQGKALIAYNDGANIFRILISVAENLYTIRVQTKGDRDKKKNKEPLENDVTATSRSIVALSSAHNTARKHYFLKLLLWEDFEKMENRCHGSDV